MLLTVLTPTYNRAHTLPRLYESLVRQRGNIDFEWLVVDDGSSDFTPNLLNGYVTESKISIRYVRKDNGGKHTAVNTGVELAHGKLLFIVDSDDWLADNSLSEIARLSARLFNSESLIGIVALKDYADGSIIGTGYPEGLERAGLRELELAGLGGERSLVFKRSYFAQYPFPVIDGEKFMTELVVYDKLDLAQGFMVLNKPLTTCEYQQDGLSSDIKRLMKSNPGGFTLLYRHRIDMASSLGERLGYILRYNYFFSLCRGKGIKPYLGKHSLLIRTLKFLNRLVSLRY